MGRTRFSYSQTHMNTRNLGPKALQFVSRFCLEKNCARAPLHGSTNAFFSPPTPTAGAEIRIVVTREAQQRAPLRWEGDRNQSCPRIRARRTDALSGPTNKYLTSKPRDLATMFGALAPRGSSPRSPKLGRRFLSLHGPRDRGMGPLRGSGDIYFTLIP